MFQHMHSHTLNRLVWTCAEQDGNPRLTNNSFGEKPLRRGTRETEPCPLSHSTSADLKGKKRTKIQWLRGEPGQEWRRPLSEGVISRKHLNVRQPQDRDWTESFYVYVATELDCSLRKDFSPFYKDSVFFCLHYPSACAPGKASHSSVD